MESSIVVNITINVNQGPNNNTNTDAKALSAEIEKAVLDSLNRQKRPGGLLA